MGRLIERVTGEPYDEYVRRVVLAPCGVTNMHIAGETLADRRSDEVVYHGQDGEDPYVYRVARMDAHGGWLASAADLVRLAVRVDDFDSVADILSGASIRAMTTPSAASPGYALGWSVKCENNWWHTGNLPGTATVLVRTSGEFCWAALANTRRSRQGDMLGDLDRLPWAMIASIRTSVGRAVSEEPQTKGCCSTGTIEGETVPLCSPV